jgi:hypothetical protein
MPLGTARATVTPIESNYEIELELCGFRLDYLYDSLIRRGLEGT